MHPSLSLNPSLRRVQVSNLAFDENGIRANLLNFHQTAYVIRNLKGDVGIGLASVNGISQEADSLVELPAICSENLGSSSFRDFYDVKYAYKTGAMANGIASEDLVIALAKNQILASFGAAGLVPQRVLEAIRKIQSEVGNRSYAFNLIHSPNEEALEREAVELFLQNGVKIVEASAFLDLTPHIVYYRVAGLSTNSKGEIQICNKVIAKVSRREVGEKFMKPAPQKILAQLVQAGKITERQAQLAQFVPMADDITVEADSGGHTDNRPLVNLVPSMISLRNAIQKKYNFPNPVRVGAAGGISTPESALGAFMMGASYIVTGSVNQACIESGTSLHVRKLLAQAGMADVMMAPASDMFEMGVKLQVLKRGTLFPMRAQKLYDLYREYNSIDEFPASERQKLEKTVFRNSLDEIWKNCVDFFNERDPEQITRAENNPKRKMALIFRWYLGLSSNWANAGVKGREMDYQIWTGPAMGAFNDWVRGTSLEKPENRIASRVADEIMTGAAYLYRIQQLKMQGITLPSDLESYQPE